MMEYEAIGKWISAISRYHQMNMARGLEHLGIGYGQYPLLLLALKSPGLRQDQLAEQLFLNKSSVARSVSQLEAAGYLRRQVDPEDRRAYCIHPTDRAEEIKEIVLDQSHAINRRLVHGLSEADQRHLLRMLQQMCDNTMPARAACSDSVGNEAACNE